MTFAMATENPTILLERKSLLRRAATPWLLNTVPPVAGLSLPWSLDHGIDTAQAVSPGHDTAQLGARYPMGQGRRPPSSTNKILKWVPRGPLESRLPCKDQGGGRRPHWRGFRSSDFFPSAGPPIQQLPAPPIITLKPGPCPSEATPSSRWVESEHKCSVSHLKKPPPLKGEALYFWIVRGTRASLLSDSELSVQC